MMDCDEEEDSNSLLSLSQTFLQPDTSSSMGLSTNQLHNWSALTSTATADAASHFSPISPPDGYNTGATNTGHSLMDSDTEFRFYGTRTSTGQQAARSSVSGLFNRSGNSNVPSMANNFQSSSRVAASEFSHSSSHVHSEANAALCYDQVSLGRSSNAGCGEKGAGYSHRSSLNNTSTSHNPGTSDAVASGFVHSGYNDDHGMISLMPSAGDDEKTGNRNVQHDQKLFDSRTKQQDHDKDVNDLYDQSSDKHLQSNGLAMSFDRRDIDSFDSSFEFSSSTRDFTVSSRMDLASVSRSEQDYHQVQKYSSTQLGENDILNNSLSLDNRRLPSSSSSSSYMNFGINDPAEDTYSRLSSSQKKSSFAHHLNDLPSDLERVFHGYHADFGGHQKLPLDTSRSFVASEFQSNDDTDRFNIKDQVNTRDISSKWSGRPRAHRKMARLLGSEDHRDYTQGTDLVSSHKSSFSKTVPSLEQVTQDKNICQQNVQRDLVTDTKGFLTMEEELDLRTNHHQQRNFSTRRNGGLDKHQNAQREIGLLQTTSTFSFDSGAVASSMYKDTSSSSMLAGQQFLPSTQLDLDFHPSLSMPQSQKDLDLNQHFGFQVSKDFGLETAHSASNQDDLSFDQSGDNQHINQPELSLPDNLGIVPHVQTELSFDAYFNTSDRDFTASSDRDFSSASDKDLCRKFSASTSRDLSYVPSASDFNIDDYMNPQRDLAQSYFSRTDLPQDMTVYQKTPIDKVESLTPFKGQEKGQSLTASKDKQGEISELQKELTKVSTKESMKGIRTPRDINRALEIFQGLQDDEREQERRKEQQQRQQYHQQLQGIVSSPKKTFQNKHNIESSSLAEQQFLGSAGNFMEDQSVGSFLDHPHLTVTEQPQDNLHMMPPYQPFTQMHQQVEVDVPIIPSKRDLQQSLTHNMTTELDYHILKRMSFSSSVKEITASQSASFSNNSSNIASILTGSSTHDTGAQFSVSGIHFPTQQADLDDVVSNSMLGSNCQPTPELNRTKNDITFVDFESQQCPYTNEKPPSAVVLNDSDLHTNGEITQFIKSKQEVEILMSCHNSLYDMMKREQFCDAVLSTSKQTVKVHQVVLCSMSQYLTNLLHNMKPAMSVYADKSSTTTSPASSLSPCPTSQNVSNHSVLLLVNCDVIKSSSITAFLMFMYLGRAELCENNILDMYMLACCFKVPTLKNLCKEFMWQAHIPNEQIKIPQLFVCRQKPEMKNQTSMTELSTENKFTNTFHLLKGMEVATQTDRSTSEAGGSSQEEWVMLKKTKQKTVSPSKSRVTNKSLTSAESPISCKAGKKGWLSPKRRYKTESQMDCRMLEKEMSSTNKELLGGVPATATNKSCADTDQLDIRQNLSSFIAPHETEGNLNLTEPLAKISCITESKPSSSCEKEPFPLCKQLPTTKKIPRTTVEIAAAAAAAKQATHSHGTRSARGIVKPPIAYAAMASGTDKKKMIANSKEKSISAMSKKKDFIKANPQTDFNSVSNSQTNFSSAAASSLQPRSDNFAFTLKDNFITACDNTESISDPYSSKSDSLTSEYVASESAAAASEQLKTSVETLISSVKRPFKKSIVHRSHSDEILNRSYGPLVSNLPSKVDVCAGSESDFMDSYLIDSIVNTIDCDSAEVDLQKVINDLDTLSKSPLLTTASSSVSSTSLTSPLKSPTVLLSTSDSSSPQKSRSAHQGFRKRLIHQINSEKNAPTSSSNAHSTAEGRQQLSTVSMHPETSTALLSSDSSAVQPSISVTANLNLVAASTAVPETTIITSSTEKVSAAVDSSPRNFQKLNTLTSISILEHEKDQQQKSCSDPVDELALTLYSLEEETALVLNGKTSSFSAMTDIDLGLNDDTGPQFLHKIFTRKRKLKARKSTNSDSESVPTKVKVKKLQVCDSEGAVAKSRQRKANGSDTEVGGARLKPKKTVSNETEGVLAKVRPPPKKRAKMELELLNSEDLETHKDGKGNVVKSEGNASKSKQDTSNEKLSFTKSEAHFSESCQMNVCAKPEYQKPAESTKKRSKNSGALEDVGQLSDLEITMEKKLTLMLEELSKLVDTKSRQFTCKLCMNKLRSARRTIKHMRSHGLVQENMLENIGIGETESEQKACDICGYRTKDQSYHYMHVHKYFKHGVPLPLGWSSDKCEICGKECFTKFQLKEHMMMHDDSHCFVCWHCGQSFKMRNSLNSHIFHKHSSIRKHQCKACGKAFKTWTQLKVHVRSHTGEKPFACTDCSHRSTTQGNMRLHLFTHGFSKDKIQELMEKISKNVPEMNSESLEQVMLSISEKVKAEQMTVKEQKSKKRSRKKKSDLDAQIKPEVANSIPKTPPKGSTSKKKTKKKPEDEKALPVSKFDGSQFKKLFMQPLNKMKPPKFLLPRFSQTSAISSTNGCSGNEDNSHSQIIAESADSNLNTLSLLLQQQTHKQDTNDLPSALLFIPFSHVDQQQHQQQHSLGSFSMGYTVIPTHILPGQVGSEASVESGGGLTLPIFSTSDVLPSGLNMLQSGVQQVQLVQADNIYTSSASSDISQGPEIVQETTSTSLRHSNSSQQQEMSADTFQTVISTNSAINETATTVMVLPAVTSTAPNSETQNHQVQAVFSYPSLMPSGQSMLLPVTPGVQLIPSSNFVNFSVTVSEQDDIASLNVPTQSFGDVVGETVGSHAETSEVLPTVAVDVDNCSSSSGLVVKCEDGNFSNEQCQNIDVKTFS